VLEARLAVAMHLSGRCQCVGTTIPDSTNVEAGADSVKPAVLSHHHCRAGLAEVKSGRTSAPRLPQAEQTKHSSISDKQDMIRPAVGADRKGVAAAVVGAVRTPCSHSSAKVILVGLCMPYDSTD
jgi:hypothetical protein